MRLFVKNKLITLRGSSKITNENGDEVFNVDGKLFSITRKKYLKDKDGNLLYLIRNKFWKFIIHKALIYDAQGNLVSTVSSKISLKSRFDVVGNRQLAVDGNILGYEYNITENGEVIASVSRKIFTLTDQFALDIKSDKDAAFLSAVIIAIDNIQDEMRDENNSN